MNLASNSIQKNRGIILLGQAALSILFFAGSWSNASAQINCKKGDCINGEGTCIYPSGAEYQGQFANGKPQGRGTLIFSDGREYIGNWEEGYRQGMGILNFANGDKYTGEFKDNEFDGNGIFVYANKNRYEGQWKMSKQHGTGIFYFANGDRYEGEFRNGLCQDQGIMYYSDGSMYVGNWKNNMRHGSGKLLFPDGEEVMGEWQDDQYLADWAKYSFDQDTSSLRNCNQVHCAYGQGKYTYVDGSVYMGDFYNGLPEGVGTVYYANGDRYEGNWKRHTPHGRGVMYYRTGRVVGAIWDFGKPMRKLFVQGEADNNPSVSIDHDPKVKIWAVIIGAATYTHMPTLRYTDDDAYQIYAFLKSPAGGALADDQIRLLIDEEATKKNIADAMNALLLRADENDVILFYFSGHGLQGSFLPVDYDGYNNQLSHQEIKTILEKSQAKHKLVLADACHSGSLLAARTSGTVVLTKYYEAFEKSEGGLALMMSSKEEEYSLEDRGLRSGIFSHFLVKGLKGDANVDNNDIVTIAELFNYVHQNVRMYTGNIQTPTLTGKYAQDMPVAFIHGPSGR